MSSAVLVSIIIALNSHNGWARKVVMTDISILKTRQVAPPSSKAEQAKNDYILSPDL